MNQQAEIKFALTPHEVDIVMNCLAEQPFKIVHGVISKMMAQANSPEMQNPASFVHGLAPVDTPAPGADTPAALTPPAIVHPVTPDPA